MLEGFIEKLLASKLGKFFAGIEKENLSVGFWSGEIVLENVYIKPFLLEQLQMPLVLKFGKVQRLVVRVPWARIQSNPVEVVLVGLYVVLTPQERSSWQYSQQGEIARRKEILVNHEIRRSQKKEMSVVSAEEEIRQKSFLDKITAKVIDNLQITIQDIHIRLEYPWAPNFSCGITLEKLEGFTTDFNWNRKFADRQRVCQEGYLIHKLITISSFALYWHSGDSMNLRDTKDENKIITHLREKIYVMDTSNYILQPINAHAKIVHNGDLTDFKRPRLNILLDLPILSTVYYQEQLHNTVTLAEYFADFNKFLLREEDKKKYRYFAPEVRTPASLWKFAIKCVIKTIRIRRFKFIPVFEMPIEMKARYKDEFKVLYHKIKKGTTLSEQEQNKYDSIIFLTPTIDLCKWTSQVLAVLDKESEIEEERKKKGSGGLLSYFWGSSKEAPPPSGDIANLFEEIETNEEISEILVPKEYITLQFNFTMEQGRVELKMKRREAGDIMEGLTLEYQNIEISLDTRTVGFDLYAKVQKCVFFSWEEGVEPLIIAEKSAEVTDPLWTLDMKYQHPKLIETSNTKFISTPLMFYFDKQALRQVISFFVIPHARDTFKTAAWDTLQEIQDSTQGRLTDILTSTSKHIIHLELSAPKLRIPAGSNAFMIDLGEIKLNNDINSINESYETLFMQIGSLEMNYMCNGFPLPVIPPFSINGNVSFIKSSHKATCSGAHIDLDLDLPEFNLILSPITYSELLRLNSAFSLEDDIWNAVTTDKSQLLEKAELIDLVQKQGQNFKNWHQYFAILSGGYIYFFEDSSDTYSTSHFYIKDCSIEEVHDENEPPNTMRLENRYGTCVLSFSTDKDMIRWWKGVDASVQKMKSTTSVAVNKAEILPPDLKWLKLHFLVSELTFTLTNQRNDPWADLKILGFSSDMLFRTFDLTGKVLVKSVWVEDARKESTFHFKTLAKSKDTDTELINIDMEICSPSSPLYYGSDAKVNLTFGELLLNWNPDLLTALFNFFEFSGYSVPQEPAPRKTLTNPNTLKQPNPDHILLDLHFKIQEITVHLNNIINEIVIAVIKLEGAESSFILCNSRYVWKGEIDNFTVHDTTDYPKTALLKPFDQIQPFCLMSTKEEAQNLLKFNIIIWSDDAPDKPTDIGSRVDVEVSSIRMVYIHQPWMRIIDYFNYLMLGLFDSTSRVRDAEHWSPITKLSFLLNLSSIESMSVEGTEQTYLNFTQMNITIKEPIIELIPRPNYKEKIIFNLGDINISNHQIEVLTRHPTLPLWMDVYRIKMKHLKISVGEDNLSENVNIDMEFQRPLLTFTQCKDINYDQSYGIKVFSTEFPLTLTQAHYCLILKCMDLNMTYDDQLDKYINTDCAPPFTPNDEDPTHGGIFLNIDINIGKLSVLFMNRHKNIAELSFIPFNMKMLKYNDYCMTMNIRSSDSLITTNENKHFPVIPDARLPSLVLGAFTHQEDMFEFKFNSHWSGNKDMVVTLRDVRMNCHMAVMTQLQYFLFYGMPEYSNEFETPLDYMTKYRPLRHHSFNETANEYLAPSIRFKAIFIKPFIVLPNTKGNRLFVSQFNFEFEYFREHEAKFTAQRCPATIKKILAEKMELYSCTIQDLTNVRSLDDLKKRKVLDPVTIEYISTENREKKLWDYYSSYMIAINLEKVRINVSHKDIVLFYNIIELQNQLQAAGKHLTESLYDKTIEEINDLDEYEPEVNSTTLKHKDSKPVFRRSASQRQRTESSELEEEPSDIDERVRSKPIPKETSHSKEPRYHIVSKTGFNCSDMRIVMINDAAGAYSPVCLFGARDLMLKQEDEIKNSIISLSGKFRSNYYNPIADCYEPLIEEFSAILEYVYSEQENEMTQIIVTIDPELPLNLNFSELAAKQTFGIIKAWSENWDSVEENNLRDIVSPFSIMNQCGYMIVVDKTRRSSVYDESNIFTVDQGQTVEYEIDATGARILDFNTEQFTFSVVQFDFELEPIQGITINKVQSINRDVRVNSEEFPMIFSVELIETRKVLKVTSAISVKNELDVRLQLLLHKKSENHEEIAKVCEPGEELYLPFDYVRGEIGLLPDLSYCSDKWHMVDLKEIAGKQSGFHAEIQCNTFYMIMTLQRNKSNPNQRTLIFKPSIVIRNMLPLPLNIGMWTEGKAREISITQGGKHFEYSVSFFQELQVELRLNSFRQSPRIKLVSRKDSPPKSVTVVDINGDSLTILLDYKSHGSRTFTFYVPVSIINNTALPFLYYYHKNGSMRRIAGQGDPNVVVPCSYIKNLTIGLEVNKSQKFKVETVGSQKVIEIKGDADREGNYINYQFVYDVHLSSLYLNEYLFTKIITISPRFVLVNNMKEDLIIIQYEVREYPTILHSKTRSPYYWPNGKGHQLINIRVLEGEDRSMYRNFGEGSVWGWSGAIAIDQIGSVTLQCRNLKDIRYFKLVRVEIKLIGTSAYVTFEEENEKYCSYRIDNLSRYISIAVYQDKSKNETRWIDTNSSSPFAWTRPLETHRLIVEFYLGSLEEYPVYTGLKYFFTPDRMHQVYKIQVDRTADTGHVIYGYTCSEGSTKVLKFADYPLFKEDTENESIKLQLTCVIPQFGISVIEHSPSRVGEILYFSMAELNILGVQTEKTFKFEIIVNTLQIDSQYNSNAVYPVLLCPNKQASKARQVLHISVGLFMDGNPNCYNFENCEILLQAIVLQLESTFIKKILHLVNRINQTNTFEDPWWLVPRRAPLWCDEAVITLDKKFYFSNFKLFPIRLHLSFMPLKDTEESDGGDVFNTVVKALGMAVTAIEAAPLKLSSIEMSDMYGSQSQIVSALLMHYKAQLTSEIFTLIGHADVLGNPIGLLNNLGNGFVDLFYEPAQGMIHGPISAGKGLIKGAGSLLKNTVQGTFGSLSKITNSVATGITILTQDKDYLMQRQIEKAKNKPRDVVDGVGQGFKSLFKNIGKGITGIVTEPIKGYKKSKFKGLMSGGLRGVAGLVVKPVAGVLDVASKTAEGIKNTAGDFDFDTNRVRPPRPVYDINGIIKAYNEYDAHSIHFISMLKKGKYAHEKFIGQAMGSEWRGLKVLAAVYLSVIILADIIKKKIIWVVETHIIQRAEIQEKGVVLYTIPSRHKKTKGQTVFLIPFRERHPVESIYKKILYVLNRK